MHSLIAGCILKRELIGLLRTKRAFWFLFATVAGAGGITLLGWPSEVETATLGARARDLFLGFATAQLALSLLTLPAFAAGLIAGERERGTWDLLVATRLRPSAVVFAKLVVASSYLLSLLVAGGPCVVAIYLQGGLEFELAALVYGQVVVAVFSSSVVCLTASLRSRSTTAAIVRSVVWLIFWNGLLGFGLLLFTQARPLTGCSPFLTIASHGWDAAGIQASDAVFFVYQAALISFHLLYLLLAAQRADELFVSTNSPYMPKSRPAAAKELNWIAQGFLARDRVQDGPALNPIFLRELRSTVVGRDWFWSVTLGATVVFTLCVLAASLSFVGVPQASVVILASASASLLGMLAVVPGIAAGSVVRERDEGNLDLLCSSLLRPGEVILGKWGAGVVGGVGFAAAAQFFLWLGFSIELYIGAVVVIVATLASASAVSVLVGTVCRSATGALVTAYAVIGSGLLGFIPVAIALGEDDGFLSLLSLAHPAIALAILVEEGTTEIAWRVFIYAAVHGVLVVGCLTAATRHWSRRVAREK